MIVADDAGGLAAAVAAVDAGRVVALPTDTLYALAASCRVPGAAERIFALKRRGRDLALPVLCADVAQASTVGIVTGDAWALAAEHWPGPLTLVVPRRPGFAVDLGGDGGTVGLRVSDDATTRPVARVAGPLATSSANLHGEDEPPTAEAIADLFGDGVALVVRRSRAGSGRASTVLRCDASGRVVGVLRAGDVAVDIGRSRPPG